jgi:hypothetical protein
MAALTGITAVRPTALTRETKGQYGETVGIGKSLYYNVSTRLWMLADANLSETAADVRGVSITPGVSGGWGYIAVGGKILIIGPTLAVGMTYFCGATAGDIAPAGDLTTGWRVSRIGLARTTSELELDLKSSGVLHP